MSKNSSALKIVKVNLADRSYPIYIGQNILPQVGVYVKGLDVGEKILIVTNPVIRELYGDEVEKSLRDAGFVTIIAEIPEGEEQKNLSSANYLYDIAFNNNLDRHSAILALGGGVIGDLAGFVAATYMRGLNFIQVPTTLLAQVDSSVGGKVAVNHPKGKNIIGAFYQPKMVFADINTLKTLPEPEFRAGMAEVIKYGVIWDREFFSFLEQNCKQIKALDEEKIIPVVETSCSIKAEIVGQDETEQNLRAVLNLGHTFGHAYETLTGYCKFVHGEAVAIGMITAAQAAVELGLMDIMEKNRLNNVVKKFGLPVCYGEISPEDIIESMYHDKKAENGKIKYIIPEGIGKVRIIKDIPHEILINVLEKQKVTENCT